MHGASSNMLATALQVNYCEMRCRLMYARLVIFKVGSGKHSTIEALVEEFDALYRAQKGFRHVFILGDEVSGEYGSFSVWESKEDAEAANAVIAPRLQQRLVVCFKARHNAGVLRCSKPKGTTPNKRVQRTAVPENIYTSAYSPECVEGEFSEVRRRGL